ncbi:MAG TPA: patatin-like phospholipase family protein [Solirubrobacteraceae bacterium]|jgi:NTE family protein|nr:patatin-like phospholipase family protein [Solirubrobacteraceae bacterium]
MVTPDVLVLGGGGTLGEAWMSSLLAGLERSEDFDARACRRYVGTSAGSIVAASLVAGLSPDARLGATTQAGSDAQARATPSSVEASLRQALGEVSEIAGAAAAPLASLALASSALGGALLRRSILRAVPRGNRSLAALGRMVEQAGVQWDGRLRIVALELATGRRVVFGAAGAPQVSVSLAVQASCAIPGVFRPVLADGRAYVDGGAWSPTNIDAAEADSGTQVLCLNPTGSLRPAAGSLAGAFGPVSRGLAGTEALALRRRGARVRTVNPDPASVAAMGINLMDPARRREVIEAGLAQGRELAAREVRRAA